MIRDSFSTSFRKLLRFQKRHFVRTHALSVVTELKYFVDKQFLPLNSCNKDLYRVINKLMFFETNRFPNLVRCKNYNDKIQWLKLFDQKQTLVDCSDKLLVKEFITREVGSEYAPLVYQSGSCFSEIDVSSLPNTFVLKTNHDSGTVVMVQSKQELDVHAVKTKIDQSLSKTYGVNSGEWPYSYIEPKVFAEEYVGLQKPFIPAPDYKFHCSEGRVVWVQYIFDRSTDVKEVIVDPKGDLLHVHFDHNMKYSEEFRRPENWNLMIDIATTLSKGFRYVRVDMFSIAELVYVGELTFFPLMGCYRGVGQELLGDRLDFDRSYYIPPYNPSCDYLH